MFNWQLLLAGFVFGIYGMWVFNQGRKNLNFQWVFIGFAMMIYPYFVEKIWLSWLIGIGLGFAAYQTR